MAGPAARVRPVHPDDADALYAICLRTGAAGEDATPLHGDPRLLGDVYVGPYLALSPDLAFVLTDAADRPVGYVLGVADTEAFEAACAEVWWPRVRAARRPGAPATPADSRLLALVADPPRTPPAVTARFPAHLHIDLLPAAQGGGHGRRLLEHLLVALREREVPGVHLGVDPANERAVGFYRHLGFEPVDDVGGTLLGLDLRG